MSRSQNRCRRGSPGSYRRSRLRTRPGPPVSNQRPLACEASQLRRPLPENTCNRRYLTASRTGATRPDTARRAPVWPNEWPNGGTRLRDAEGVHAAPRTVVIAAAPDRGRGCARSSRADEYGGPATGDALSDDPDASLPAGARRRMIARSLTRAVDARTLAAGVASRTGTKRPPRRRRDPPRLAPARKRPRAFRLRRPDRARRACGRACRACPGCRRSG